MPSTVAAIPLHRNAVIFSRCQIGASARSTTAILVSKRIACSCSLFSGRFGGTSYPPRLFPFVPRCERRALAARHKKVLFLSIAALDQQVYQDIALLHLEPAIVDYACALR